MEPSELRDLLHSSLSRPGYGETAEEILGVCRLVAQAEKELGKKELFNIKSVINMSPQVWKRMIAVSKKNLLWEHRSMLPPNFSSIYRLSLFDDAVLKAKLDDGSITPQSSSRSIEHLKKETVIRKSYKTSRSQVYLFVQDELDDESLRLLLDEVNIIARRYNACFDTEDLEEIRKENMQKMFSLRRQLIESRIQSEVQMLLTDRSINPRGDTRGDSGIYAIQTCLNLNFGDFVKMLKSLSANREAMMRDFGRLYCLKLSHEYWRTTSRAQRYNYKRRLVEVQENYPVHAKYAQFVLNDLIELDC